MPEMEQKPLELVPKGFIAGDPLGMTDATPFNLTMMDKRGREYVVKFRVRNVFVGLVNQAIRRLIPMKRSHD